MDWKNRKGQTSAVEYALTFFLVVAVLVSMSAYVRRAIQGRTRDALNFMAETVKADYSHTFRYQYEPYYMNSEAIKVQKDTDHTLADGVPGFASDGVMQQYGEKTTAYTNQWQLPPSFAN
jgi:hypothetical protein